MVKSQLRLIESDEDIRTPRVRRVERLWDQLVATPKVTIYEIADHLECSRMLANRAIHDLRELLADSDINVIAEPQGQYEPWAYRLVGTYDEAKPWMGNRTNDLVGRIATIKSVARSVTKHEKGKARLRAKIIADSMEQCLTNLENLDLLDHQA